MNDRQNTVVATTISGLLLVLVFLCPWRVESSGEIAWSPVYQQPLSQVRTYDTEYGSQGGTRIESEEAHVAVDLLILQVLVVGTAGVGLYRLTADSEEDHGAA